MWNARAIVAAVVLSFAPAGSGAPTPVRYQPAIDNAFERMYSSDYSGAQTVLDTYIQAHPDDPVPYATKASSYLFGELDRLGILESEFFSSNQKIGDGRSKPALDTGIRAKFYGSVEKAHALADSTLRTDPDNPNALFALCLALGSQTDFTALIEKHQLASLSLTRQGYREAKHLLRVDPRFYDAYLTTGFTEYLIGSLPSVVRVFVRFDDVRGDKVQALQKLNRVAVDGHYLKPFAKILLATAALREKRPKDAQTLLQDLTQTYPANRLLRRELDKVNLQVRQGS